MKEYETVCAVACKRSVGTTQKVESLTYSITFFGSVPFKSVPYMLNHHELGRREQP